MVHTNDDVKSKQQLMVECFMRTMSGRQANQSVPVKPTVRDVGVCALRARLMLEETMETIELGLGLRLDIESLRKLLVEASSKGKTTIGFKEIADVKYSQVTEVNLIELAGNLADMDVVGPCGTSAAFGIAHEPIMNLVCGNNLLKFAPGHSYREDGKLIKSPDHPAPENMIAFHLTHQGLPDYEASKALRQIEERKRSAQ